MTNRQTINIIKDASKNCTNVAQQRAFEKAVAALEYCSKLTYYIEEKKFG